MSVGEILFIAGIMLVVIWALWANRGIHGTTVQPKTMTRKNSRHLARY